MMCNLLISLILKAFQVPTKTEGSVHTKLYLCYVAWNSWTLDSILKGKFNL